MKSTFLRIAVLVLMLVFPLATAKAQSYSRTDLPPLLEFLDGRGVKTTDDWKERREEVRSLLVKYFIGTFPSETPRMAGAETVSDATRDDGSRRRRIRITWATPHRASFEMAVWTPRGKGPFPLLLTAPRDYQLFWAEDALARGYAVCLFPGVDSHHREDDYPGYEKIWETFRREYPNATWTEISTKGWLASRCIDYLLSDQSVVRIEPEHIGIIGFSRYGKQSMIAAAFDPRITCVVARSPGSPASSPYRLTSRNTFAEAPTDFPGQWFLPSLRDYHGREHELPIDAHGWYALIAPRRCLIHTAHNDGSEPTFAVEKAYLEGRSVYRFLDAEQNLRIDYRTGGHGSVGPERISAADRKRNLDWIDLSFDRGSVRHEVFPEKLLHDFDWNAWRACQDDTGLFVDRNAPVLDRLNWLLGEPPKSLPAIAQPEFLSKEESDLMTHDRWVPRDVRRVPIRFGDGVRGNLYFKAGLTEPTPVVVWLHPLSYHSGYNEGYGVQGTTVYHRLAENGFAVIAYDQCGFGGRLLEGTMFYDRHPRWSRLGRMVRDARAAVRFAVEGCGTTQSAVPTLDANRVFLLGYSTGAITAMYTAALEERVAGTACFSGWTPMRRGTDQRLWELHALAPRLGLYQSREDELPLDYEDILQLVARRPCLLVTPRRDRFADHDAVTDTMQSLRVKSDTITWHAPDDINRFQADQHKIFLDWVRTVNSASAAGRCNCLHEESSRHTCGLSRRVQRKSQKSADRNKTRTADWAADASYPSAHVPKFNFEYFHDFVALNKTLRQEERTAEVFKWLDQEDEEDARRIFNIAEPALIKQKAYEICGRYIDPERDVSRIGDSYSRGLKMAKRFGKQHQEFVNKDLLNDAAILVAILVKNNRQAEAKKVAEDIKEFVSDAKLSVKLQRALDSALTGTVPTPWP